MNYHNYAVDVDIMLKAYNLRRIQCSFQQEFCVRLMRLLDYQGNFIQEITSRGHSKDSQIIEVFWIIKGIK